MNKKKLLALLMALVMVLTLVPVTALAEVVDSTSDNAVAEVGGTYYSDLQEAIAVAMKSTEESNKTVNLLKNVSVDTWYQNVFATSHTGSGTEIEYDIREGFNSNSTVEWPGSVTIEGNDYTLTVQNILSAGNGNSLFKYAENLTVRDLTVVAPDGISIQSGLIENVTFNMAGGAAIYTWESTGAENDHVEIIGCTFNSPEGDYYAIYSNDDGLAKGTVIANNTFNTKRSVVLRNDEQFLRNVVNGAKGVTVATGSTARVEGNYFTTGNTSRSINIYPAPQAVITGNVILGDIELETDKEYSSPQDLSGNYWGGGAPETVEGKTVSNSYYDTADIYAERHEDGTLFALSNSNASVAQIGDVKYPTLAEAIAAANADTTATAENPVVVKLLQNTSISATIGITNHVTLDGNGKTITAENTATRGIWIDKGNVTVSVKNLTIAGSKLERAIQVNTDKDNVTLTIDNVTATATMYTVNVCGSVDDLELNINGCNLTGWGVINLWGNNGDVEVTNSTLVGVNDKGYNADGWNDFGTVIVEGDTTGQTDTHASAYNISISNTTISASQTTGNQQFALLYNDPSVNNAITLTGCSISLGGNCSFLCNQSDDGVEHSTTKIKNTFVSGTSDTLPVLPAVYTYVDVADDYKQVALHYVAQVGDVKYTSLEAAVAAAPSGATVTLIDDIDYSTVYTVRNARDNDDEHAIDLGNLTLDMDNHSISTINATVVFGGNGATIKNGTFSLVPKNTDGSYKDGSYALIIDNAVNDHGASGTVLVKNVTCEGGINLCSADVTLDNVTASTTPTKFYAVWAEQNAKVTILGGTYTDTQSKGKGVLATGKNAEGGAKIYVTGGYYNAVNKLVYSAEANSIQITGGIFTKDPTTYVAPGYEAVQLTSENNYGGETETYGNWYKVGEVSTTTLTEAQEVKEGFDATYTATKTVTSTDNNTELDSANNITVNIETKKAESTPTSTVADKAVASLDNIKEMADLVATVTSKTGDATEVNVLIQVAKSAADTSVANKVTYEVHPEAVISTVTNNQVTEVATVALDNNQIQGTFSFKLYVPTTVATVGETVTVTHIHEDGNEENLGVFTVEEGNVITIRNIKEFSFFGVEATQVATTGNEDYFGYIGASLRRRVKTTDYDTVVNSSTDIRFTYEIKGSKDLKYFFQWKLGEYGNWSNAVEVKEFNADYASLVIVGVPEDYFGSEIYTRIYVENGGQIYTLSNDGDNTNRSVEQVATALRDGSNTPNMWIAYAKYLLKDSDAVETYSINYYKNLND